MHLGQSSAYPSEYAPELLHPISRSLGRATLGINRPLPFSGADIWTAYEISFLDAKGKPQVRIGEITFLATSPCLVESKSLKLYLSSFHQLKIKDDKDFVDIVEHDLTRACGAPVKLTLYPLDGFRNLAPLLGTCLDDLDVGIEYYEPHASLLQVEQAVVEETVYSHLLKSNCPVTGQPDWATVIIQYAGPRMKHADLLRYIISYRKHTGFHEQCVEQIFVDLQKHCQPARLTVSAHYTRRGGLDINPSRSTEANVTHVGRLHLRQ